MNFRNKDPDAASIGSFIVNEDAGAFERLFDKYHENVYRYCFRFLGNEDDAADCTQEIFIRIYRGLKKFKHRSLFSTWLYRIMINTCNDSARAMTVRAAFRPTATMEYRMDNITREPSPDPEKSLVAKEINEAFRQGLSLLNESQRTVIILRDLEGRSYEEIGKMARMKPGTVRSTLARARFRMAGHLKEYRYGL